MKKNEKVLFVNFDNFSFNLTVLSSSLKKKTELKIEKNCMKKVAPSLLKADKKN